MYFSLVDSIPLVFIFYVIFYNIYNPELSMNLTKMFFLWKMSDTGLYLKVKSG